MPTYKVYFAQSVVEEGSIDIKAKNKDEAMRRAGDVDPGEIENWKCVEVLGPASIVEICGKEG